MLARSGRLTSRSVRRGEGHRRWDGMTQGHKPEREWIEGAAGCGRMPLPALEKRSTRRQGGCRPSGLPKRRYGEAARRPGQADPRSCGRSALRAASNRGQIAIESLQIHPYPPSVAPCPGFGVSAATEELAHPRSSRFRPVPPAAVGAFRSRRRRAAIVGGLLVWSVAAVGRHSCWCV